MLTRKNLFILSSLVFLIASCGSDPLDVDVSKVKLDIEFIDLRTAMHDLEGDNLLKAHDAFKKDIPDIFNYFLGACVGFQEGYSDSTFLESMKLFQQDQGIQTFESEIDKAFQDTDPIQKKLINGFKHLKYHIPNGHMPTHIVFMNTLFRSGVWCTENEIGIGLGNYLGPDSETVKKANPPLLYDWMKKVMLKKYLERDVVENWVRTHLVKSEQENLASDIIYEGKVIYLTRAAFPDMPEHIVMRYSKEDWAWAEKNELAFWQYLGQNKMLFKNEEITRMNLLNPGPKTPGLPIKGSPDRLGKYLGYKIVCDYMEATEATVAQLIDIDYSDVLQEYKPEE